MVKGSMAHRHSQVRWRLGHEAVINQDVHGSGDRFPSIRTPGSDICLAHICYLDVPGRK